MSSTETAARPTPIGSEYEEVHARTYLPESCTLSLIDSGRRPLATVYRVEMSREDGTVIAVLAEPVESVCETASGVTCGGSRHLQPGITLRWQTEIQSSRHSPLSPLLQPSGRSTIPRLCP